MSTPNHPSFVPVNRELGEIFNDPSLALFANPYCLSAAIPPDTIRQFYNVQTDLENDPHQHGWMHVELGAHDPDELIQATADLRRARAQTRSPLKETAYADSSIALACMPLFIDQAHGETPTSHTLQNVRKNLLGVLDDGYISAGNKGTAAVILLGVEQSLATGDPQYLIYPTSPREGRSVFRGLLGERLNHDCYTLNADGTGKHPIEVKLTARSTQYADDIFCYPIVKRMQTVIIQNDLYKGEPGLREAPSDKTSRTLIHRFVSALRGYGNRADNQAMLQGLQATLWNGLEAHKRRFPRPGAISTSLSKWEKLSRHQTATTDDSSPTVGGLLAVIQSTRKELVQPDLFMAEQHLLGTLSLLTTAAESSPTLQTASESILAAQRHLRSILTETSVAYRALQKYAQNITFTPSP